MWVGILTTAGKNAFKVINRQNPEDEHGKHFKHVKVAFSSSFIFLLLCKICYDDPVMLSARLRPPEYVVSIVHKLLL